MTMWKNELKPESDYLQNRLGEIYQFLKQAEHNDDFLTDYECLKSKLKPISKDWQLSDYSLILLPIVKYYENSLWYICEKLDLFNKFNGGKRPRSLRMFFDNKEKEIDEMLVSKIGNEQTAKKVSRRLFSTIDDYEKRNEVVHCGELISFADLDNYDSLITKLKELVEFLFENNLLQKN